jgi:hypothetical protein
MLMGHDRQQQLSTLSGTGREGAGLAGTLGVIGDHDWHRWQRQRLTESPTLLCSRALLARYQHFLGPPVKFITKLKLSATPCTGRSVLIFYLTRYVPEAAIR